MAITLKEQAHELIESLPEDATWEDFKYAIYVRAEIEASVRSRDEGPMVANNEARARFGLKTLK